MIQTKTIQTEGALRSTIQRRLKAKNKRFKALTKPKQRIAIARDVIAQLKAGKFSATSIYFDFGGPSEYVLGTSAAVEANMDMSECIAQTSCQVCGIGGLFASAVLNADHLPVADFFDRDMPLRQFEVNYLKKWFSVNQLNLVECFFEKWDEYKRHDYRITIEDHVINTSPIFTEGNQNDCLTMIMQNIISNGGKFDPAKGRHRYK